MRVYSPFPASPPVGFVGWQKVDMDDRKFCSYCSYFKMDLGAAHGKWYSCRLHKKYIVDDSQAEKCPDFWKIFTPKPERRYEIEDELNARIAELESIVDKLAEAGTDLYHRVRAESYEDASVRADWRELMRTYKKDWVI